MTLAELTASWRSDAARFRAWGQDYLARTLEHAASEVERTILDHEHEELTVADAARASGFSESQLRRRFPGRRTIARGLLPKKGERQLGPNIGIA